MDLRLITADDGTKFLAVEDLQALLRATAEDWVSHIPAHIEKGELIEAALDRHAGFILRATADTLNGELAADT